MRQPTMSRLRLEQLLAECAEDLENATRLCLWPWVEAQRNRLAALRNIQLRLDGPRPTQIEG